MTRPQRERAKRSEPDMVKWILIVVGAYVAWRAS